MAGYNCLRSSAWLPNSFALRPRLQIDDLRRYVRDWLACNFARQLRALRFRAPFEVIRKPSTETDRYTMGVNS
ncbi:integrase [Rhodomicrobium udaipurense JA643]|nr:integrase [Rhodomicrobium udaipurense JA643]